MKVNKPKTFTIELSNEEKIVLQKAKTIVEELYDAVEDSGLSSPRITVRFTSGGEIDLEDYSLGGTLDVLEPVSTLDSTIILTEED